MAKQGVIRHFKNYILSNFGLKALGIVSIPILTNVLSTEDYGIVNVFASYVSILAILSSFYAHSSVTRFYFEQDDSFPQFLGTVLLIVLGFPCLLFAIAIPFLDNIALLLGLPKKILWFLLPALILQNIQIVQTNYYKAIEGSKYLMLYNLSRGYFNFFVLLAVVFSLKKFLYLASPISTTITLATFGTYGLLKILQIAKFQVRKEHLIYIMKFSIPLIPAGLSGIILTQIDRVMLGKVTGMSEAGMYSFAYNIAQLHTMIMNSLMSAHTPLYYKSMNNGDEDGMDKAMKSIAKILAVSATALILFGDVLGMILANEKYHDYLYLIPIVVIGLFYFSFSPFYKRGISYSKKTIFTTLIILSSGVLNIVLNYYFIPLYGAVAAAYTTLGSYCFQFVFTYIIAKYVIGNYITSLRKIVLPLLMVPVSFAAYQFLDVISIGMIALRILLFTVISYALFRIAIHNYARFVWSRIRRPRN